MMAGSNMDDFFEAQFQAARKLFEDNDNAYERACLRLLADPALPLRRRVTCCYMIAHQFENSEFYTQQGLETLQKIEELINEGRIGDRFMPWVVKARTNFEALRLEVKTSLEEQEADVVEQDEAVVPTKEAKGMSIAAAAEEEEKEEAELGVTKDVEGRESEEESASSVVQSQDMSGLTQIATSTKPTSVGVEVVERGASPSLSVVHPAVQQMEDDADMLFGDDPAYEHMSPEEQEAWRAAAPERLRKRMREEYEEEDIAEEGHVTKK